MNHTEAVQNMATERYLLDELTPELRDAFEEHMFDCQECAMDVRAGSVFLTEAKIQLPAVMASEKARVNPVVQPERRKPWWSFWLTPAFAAPVFAALLGVVAYQNAVLIPGLRMEATEPHLSPWTSLRMGTRGAEATVVHADRKEGAGVLIEDLPQQPAYTSYAFELRDPQGKTVWTKTWAASAQKQDGESLSLTIPGAGLKQGTYTLSIAGISPEGARTPIGQRVLDVHLDE